MEEVELMYGCSLMGDRLVQINGRPLATFEEASELLGGGPDLVQLRLAHRRHDGSPASPRRSKRRGVSREGAMGSNVSRHSGKGLSGRRTQSSGNLCNGNKILAPNVGRVLDTCGVGAKDRNKFCGSLPNHLDVNSDGTTPPPPPPACNNTLKNQRNVELRLHALDPTTLHDQGYGSERSPEEEHPPRLKGWVQYPFITQESTFDACLLKGSRGLGLSVTGGIDTPEQWPGLVRIKRLFPHQPAWQSGLLAHGDILLAANGVPLVGLTNYQALEVLRKTPSNVVLTVCRPPLELCCLLPPSDPPPPPPPPPRRDPAYSLLPLPPLQTEGPLGEFDIMLTKVNRSLGFTLRKEDDSALGHYVRALVREPALSDGRIRPGDKIVAVNDVDISPMSHEEAVMFLRQCGDVVKLRLYRDAAQTPVSALSPTEEAKVFRPKPPLRKEAMDMLSDLAGRKLLPSESGESSGSSYSKLRRVSDGQSSSTCSSPRRRRLAKTPSPDITASTQDRLVQKYLVSGQMGTSDSSEERSSLDSTRARGHGSSFASTADSFEGEMRPTRPNFLDLCGGIGTPSSSRKHKFTFTVASTEDERDNEDWDSLAPTANSEELPTSTTAGSASQFYSNSSEDCGEGPLPTEPASMPPLTNLSSTSSTSTAFSYRNPAYQSAHPGHPTHSQGMKKSSEERASDQDIPGKVFTCQPGTGSAEGSRGLLKWKGVVFTPEAETEEGSENVTSGTDDSSSQVVPEREHGDQVFMVELTRGWNSRLGFSLQGDGNLTYISAIYADSVAAKDGRLQAGDQVLMVNDESVEEMSTADVIDLLRKIRGTIGITVLRKSGPNL